MPDDAAPAAIGHNKPPAGRAQQLHDHILALERLQDVKDDAAADYNERMSLVKEDGFDRNVVGAFLKRRKNGKGQTAAFDEMLAEYEQLFAEIEAEREQEGEADEEPPAEPPAGEEGTVGTEPPPSATEPRETGDSGV